jgi:hypothetical protein
MRSAETRLQRLEGGATGAATMYVIIGPAEKYDTAEFLRSLGHEPTPSDLIVRISRFVPGAAPALVSQRPL